MLLLKLVTPCDCPRIFVLIIDGKLAGFWHVPKGWELLVELAIYWEWAWRTCPD